MSLQFCWPHFLSLSPSHYFSEFCCWVILWERISFVDFVCLNSWEGAGRDLLLLSVVWVRMLSIVASEIGKKPLSLKVWVFPQRSGSVWARLQIDWERAAVRLHCIHDCWIFALLRYDLKLHVQRVHTQVCICSCSVYFMQYFLFMTFPSEITYHNWHKLNAQKLQLGFHSSNSVWGFIFTWAGSNHPSDDLSHNLNYNLKVFSVWRNDLCNLFILISFDWIGPQCKREDCVTIFLLLSHVRVFKK